MSGPKIACWSSRHLNFTVSLLEQPFIRRLYQQIVLLYSTFTVCCSKLSRRSVYYRTLPQSYRQKEFKPLELDPMTLYKMRQYPLRKWHNFGWTVSFCFWMAGIWLFLILVSMSMSSLCSFHVEYWRLQGQITELGSRMVWLGYNWFAGYLRDLHNCIWYLFADFISSFDTWLLTLAVPLELDSSPWEAIELRVDSGLPLAALHRLSSFQTFVGAHFCCDELLTRKRRRHRGIHQQQDIQRLFNSNSGLR